eukprot:3228651-Pyramimonas_sp.AAC.1
MPILTVWLPAPRALFSVAAPPRPTFVMLEAQVHRECELGQRLDEVVGHHGAPLLDAPAAAPPELLRPRGVLVQVAHEPEQVAELSLVVRRTPCPTPRPAIHKRTNKRNSLK